MENTNTLSWEDLTNAEQDVEIYSDLYKDVYGVRPRDLERFMALSDAERQEELRTLSACNEVEMEVSRDEADEAFANRMWLMEQQNQENQSRQDDEPYAELGDMEWK